jgi:protein SCO1/2
MNRRELFTNFAGDTSRPSASLGAKYFTNALLRTHENKEVRFYDDLIKDKHVIINFMYANCEGACPAITANLVKVQESLQKRVGRDIFMYSITLKPEQDDPMALHHYAEMHRVKPGWLFLTGNRYDIDTIRFRMFRWNHPGLDLNINQHTGMIRVINDPINRWAGCSALASRETILQVISFAEPMKPLEVRLEENARAQARIDKMEILPTWLNSLGTEK